MEPALCGILRKSGGGALKRDQDRWFELKGASLHYYKSKAEEHLGCVELRGTSVTTDTKKKSIHIEGGRLTKTYVLYSANEEEFKEWGTAIHKASKGGEEQEHEPKTEKKTCLDDFELLELIGKGAFGKVVKVKRKSDGMTLAMKSLPKSVIVRENLVEYTKSERNILMTAVHPFIVKLHNAFQTDDKLYLVLDYLPGGEIFYHLSNAPSGKFPEHQAKFYTAQIGTALGFLHSRSILYRDLKPENCVLDKDGNCCLTDFGLAKRAGKEQESDTFCGTPAYLAPEFMLGVTHTKAIDWWSLGVLFYEMVVGMVPFYSPNMNEMYEEILTKPVAFEGEDISLTGQQFCARLLERDVTKRIQSTDDMAGHPYFEDIDFEKLVRKEIKAPFVPEADREYNDVVSGRTAHSVVSRAPCLTNNDFENFTYDASEQERVL
eukprot:TRINITY_DN1234_c0_g5_i1.p1 TRINITY_DN1234_c0_g5~~TRINITY_DN1234_c0_g5_i1.p1  ORF type:complete len:447 (+),score=67.08 TRINITY_DN1234_c0_g5_i1:42-1343(+)